MPSSLFSHQAPGLLLKIKYPKKFDGTALCISTIIPDIYILFHPFLPFELRNLTHSLIGLFVLTIPLSIILTIIFSMNIGPFLAKRVQDKAIFHRPLRYFGIDKFDVLKNKKIDKRFFVVSSYSALIGGLSHLLLDLPSHGNIEFFFPVILQTPEILLHSIIDYGTFSFGSIELEGNIQVFDLIWLIETIVFLIITLYLLRLIRKRDLIHKWYEVS
ncbi:MAG: DUF4184 family protein [Candidatus Hermodarchaeota archaeon]